MPTPRGFTKEELDNLSPERKATMSRWAAGIPPTKDELKDMGQQIQEKRDRPWGSRDMYDSPELQKAMKKMKR